MIGVIFQYINEIVEVRVSGNHCVFRTGQFGGAFVTIDSLRLDKTGVIKEHPDLKDRDDWRVEAINRFKEKMKTMENDNERIKYIVSELTKVGYKPLYLCREGFRPQKFKWQ